MMAALRRMRPSANRRLAPTTLAAILVLLSAAATCSDDLARAAANADELFAKESQYGDEVADLLRASDESASLRAFERMKSIDDELAIPEETCHT